MGPNRQRKARITRIRRQDASKKMHPSSPSRKNESSMITNAGRDLIIDVLHHAASGGSVPVPEKHFDPNAGTRITLYKNIPVSHEETLRILFEALGFPREIVVQYIEDLVQSSEVPVFANIRELMAEDGAHQAFLVNSSFELFDCMASFSQEEPDLDVAPEDNNDELLTAEIDTLRELFSDSLLSIHNSSETKSNDCEMVLNFSTKDNVVILVAIRIAVDYPSEPPSIFLQPRKGNSKALLVYPLCTKEFSAVARRMAMDAAIEVINTFRGNSCLLPLVSALRDVIGSIAAKAPAPSSTTNTRSEATLNSQEMAQQRKAFLSALTGQANSTDDKNPDRKSFEVIMPEKVQMQTVEPRMNTESEIRTEYLAEHSHQNKILKEAWDKLREGGALRDDRRALPAYQARENLKEALRTHNVVVIRGETGSGKTTQIPQYVYEFMCEDGKGSSANIVCTQPRRLAATSVAVRVAEERDDTVGGLVGYSIRLENRTSRRTQITYCTTGVLFRRLQSDKYIGCVSHVVVDEVHERGVDTDFLLILLRDLLAKRSDLKVIVMSATMDADLFARYFGGAPIISIKGRTYPVEVMHLEEIIPAVNYTLEDGSPYAKISTNKRSQRNNARKKGLDVDMQEVEEDLKEMEAQKQFSKKVDASATTLNTLSRMNLDIINYELIEMVVRYIQFTLRIEGGVLIFMPGMAEIQRCMEQLQADEGLRRVCLFYNLHSSLGSSEQQGVFRRPPCGKRKIIIGTNIMETSITIDDAVFVIDTGKVKENRYNARKSLSELVTVNVSKANCRQRQGRAGRVREGFCFRLFTKEQFESFAEHQLCEMHRVPLESLVLQIYALHLGNEVEYLQKALTPPEERAIQSSVRVLTTLGALTTEKRLTSLGQHLANLPLDVRVGKMIIHGALLQCLDPVLTIAACLATRSPFIASMDLRREVEAIRRAFAGDQASDHLSSWYAYRRWLSALIEDGVAAARKVCTEFYLSSTSLSQIQLTKRQYERYLYEANFLERDGARERLSSNKFIFAPYITLDNQAYEAGGERYNTNSSSVQCILACLVAGLYPNVASFRRPHGLKKTSPAFFLTFDGSPCLIHPSSVIRKDATLPSQLVVYVDKIKTTSTFLRDVSFVYPLQVILFGGAALEYLPNARKLCVDDLTAFRCNSDDAELLKHLKNQLESALTLKINDPSRSWDSVSSVVMRAIVRLLKDIGSGMHDLTVVDHHPTRATTSATVTLSQDVPQLPTPTLVPPEGQPFKTSKACFFCGQEGHVSKYCPAHESQKRGGPPVRCFICGQWHFPQDCTLVMPLDM